jgi:hypothetical protein
VSNTATCLESNVHNNSTAFVGKLDEWHGSPYTHAGRTGSWLVCTWDPRKCNVVDELGANGLRLVHVPQEVGVLQDPGDAEGAPLKGATGVPRAARCRYAWWWWWGGHVSEPGACCDKR